MKREFVVFQELIDKYRYEFDKLVYIIFPFGEKGTELEFYEPYEWQLEEWRAMSAHLRNPLTRYETYRLIVSSGNGAAKTAFGAMTMLMLMYTQRVRGRVTANTQPQLASVVWPEYDIWYRRARYHEQFFEKFGTTIKAKNPELAETWRLDAVTWDETSPASISGLHNKGGAVLYIFEEAPGIPAVIWDYTRGAFTETETIKIFLAFGNSDDPESKFEQNMGNPLWRSRRIDTRTLPYIDPKFWADILTECNGDEDHDEFRVRVRGLPRKSAKDSIIGRDAVDAAIDRGTKWDGNNIDSIPRIIGVDPAWQGGDETVIWYRHGAYTRLLEKFKLNRDAGEDHSLTFARICYWEQKLGVDAVNIDQAEGTALMTLATMSGRTHWMLFSFAQVPNDQADAAASTYANLRAQMYHEANAFLRTGGVITSERAEWIEDIRRQLTWTKGTRHRVTGKKLAEPKIDIKKRVGQSPDVADAFVLLFARPVMERLVENQLGGDNPLLTGQTAYQMPDLPNPYETMDADYRRLYD